MQTRLLITPEPESISKRQLRSIPVIVATISILSSFALVQIFFGLSSLTRTYPATLNSGNEHNIGRLGAEKESRYQHRPSPSSRVHLVAVADEDFAKKYQPLFEENDKYSNFYKYKWHIISGENIELCEKRHKDFFFRKHCIVAEWMGNSLNENDVVFVFDSDVVPFRFDESLENWTSTDEDVIFYERIWNTEIMAGNYIARNNQRARMFLRGWAEFEFEKPTGFSSADNGKHVID